MPTWCPPLHIKVLSGLGDEIIIIHFVVRNTFDISTFRILTRYSKSSVAEGPVPSIMMLVLSEGVTGADWGNTIFGDGLIPTL